MTMTIAELVKFQKPMTFLTQLRAIPLPVIEFYLENEHGYILEESAL
ncbi:MAG TPA: hypothetical protein PLD30_03555 [Candidatus Competibacteraceae bacterium]|nr:hypothetical protein [Candidatus Competibacteraceae bacterium]